MYSIKTFDKDICSPFNLAILSIPNLYKLSQLPLLIIMRSSHDSKKSSKKLKAMDFGSFAACLVIVSVDK